MVGAEPCARCGARKIVLGFAGYGLPEPQYSPAHCVAVLGQPWSGMTDDPKPPAQIIEPSAIPPPADDQKIKVVLQKLAEEEAEIAAVERTWRKSAYALETAKNRTAMWREYIAFIPMAGEYALLTALVFAVVKSGYNTSPGYTLGQVLWRLHENWKGALILGGLLLYRALHELLSRITKASKDGVELAPGARGTALISSGGSVGQAKVPPPMGGPT